MQALRERILRDGKDLGSGILKVDGFINHQVDPGLMFECGKELAACFRDVRASKVITAEISGIGPALLTAYHLGLPLVYARKTKPVTMPRQVFLPLSSSHTKGLTVELIVSAKYLHGEDRLLIVDDSLPAGPPSWAWLALVPSPVHPWSAWARSSKRGSREAGTRSLTWAYLFMRSSAAHRRSGRVRATLPDRGRPR